MSQKTQARFSLRQMFPTAILREMAANQGQATKRVGSDAGKKTGKKPLAFTHMRFLNLRSRTNHKLKASQY